MFPQLANVRSLLYEWNGTTELQVEIAIRPGLPTFQVLGLAQTTTKESRDRIRMALEASGYYFPMQTVVVNLRPTHIRKRTVFLDLAIAVSLLKATAQIPKKEITFDCILLGNLGLDGSVFGGNELLPLVWLSARKGENKFILPADLREKSLPEGTYTFIETLQDLALPLPTLEISSKEKEISIPLCKFGTVRLTLDQTKVFQGLLYSLLGGHHSLVLGSPGSGKTFLHHLLKELLPPLTSLEKVKYQSMSSNFDTDTIPRPFRNPHHSATEVGLLGGGSPLQMGEITLSHGGILFLDEALEFKERILESLREPMEEGYLEVVRVRDKVKLPASFTLLLAANPCPCGNYQSNHFCHCSLHKIRMYLQKISGAFLDRITIFQTLFSEDKNRNVEIRESEIRKQIHSAFEFREARLYKNEGKENDWDKSKLNLDFYKSRFNFRKQKQLIELTRTIADFDLSSQIKEAHIREANHYLSGYEWIYSLG